MRFFLSAIIISFLLICTAHAQTVDQFFNSNGVRIRYLVVGTGEPVILIHGWSSFLEQNWSPVIKDLSADHKVIALDCRGHGKSDKPSDPKRYGVEMVNDVIRLMDHLSIRRAHMVGYSMGAMIAMKLMVEHPDRVISAIIAGHGGVREDTLERSEDPMLKYLDQGMTVSEATIASLPPNEPQPSKVELLMMKFLDGNDSKALAASLRSFNDLIVTNKQLSKNRIPTLALYSIEGEMVKPLKNLMPNVELKAIEGANHMTAPLGNTFKESIRDFIVRHSSIRKATGSAHHY